MNLIDTISDTILDYANTHELDIPQTLTDELLESICENIALRVIDKLKDIQP